MIHYETCSLTVIPAHWDFLLRSLALQRKQTSYLGFGSVEEQTGRLLGIIRHLSKQPAFQVWNSHETAKLNGNNQEQQQFVLSGKVCLPASLSSFCCWWHKGKNTLEKSQKHEGSEGLAVCPPGFSGVRGHKMRSDTVWGLGTHKGMRPSLFLIFANPLLAHWNKGCRHIIRTSSHHHHVSITSAQWQHHNTDITASHQHYNIITSTSQHQHHITRHSSTSSTFLQ